MSGDGMGPGQRRMEYLKNIESLARRGALSGRPGPWLEILRRAISAQQAQGTACDVGLHAQYLELDLWGQLIDELVLSEHHPSLAGAIHQVGREQMMDRFDENGLVLGVVCPEPHRSSFHAPPDTCFEELVLIRRLREAGRSTTAPTVEAALRTALALRVVDDDRHPNCWPSEVLGLRGVVIEALDQTMPWLPRRLLATVAQDMFYRSLAPDEDPPEFLCEAPRRFWAGGGVWPFSPIWLAVANGNVRNGTCENDSVPWLIEEFETVVDAWREHASATSSRAPR